MIAQRGSGGRRLTPAAATPPDFTPGERIRLARDNLCLAMSLFAASHQGLITTSFVQPAPALHRPTGEVSAAPAGLELPDDPALVRCAGNQVRGAFVLSVLQTERELAGLWGKATPATGKLSAIDSDLASAGMAVSLLARSVERSLIAPVWDVPAGLARRYAVAAPGFTLDAAGLDGLEVRWEHFGGLPRYLDLTLYLARRLDENAGVRPGAGGNDYGRVGRLAARPAADADRTGPATVKSGYGAGAGRRRQQRTGADTDDNSDTPAGWVAPGDNDAPAIAIAPSAASAGPVDDFITDACATGRKAMTLAGELYTCYARWCLDNGYLAVSQRKFGLELTASGYARKRRGKGKHWWMGLQPRE